MPAYAEVEPFVLPATWPPTPPSEAAMAAYIDKHGMRAYRAAVTAGQYVSPDGVFYGGKAPSWSNRTMRGILRRHGAAATHIGWIDIHTGLGPYGHGEKIYPGRTRPASPRRAPGGAPTCSRPSTASRPRPTCRGRWSRPSTTNARRPAWR